MRVIPSSVLLSLVTLAVLPAWHSSCRGQDVAIAQKSPEASHQPQQDSSQKPTGTTPNTSPGSQQATISSGKCWRLLQPRLDDTVDAGEMDDDLGSRAPERWLNGMSTAGRTSPRGPAWGFWVDTGSLRAGYCEQRADHDARGPKTSATSDSFLGVAFKASRAKLPIMSGLCMTV